MNNFWKLVKQTNFFVDYECNFIFLAIIETNFKDPQYLEIFFETISSFQKLSIFWGLNDNFQVSMTNFRPKQVEMMIQYHHRIQQVMVHFALQILFFLSIQLTGVNIGFRICEGTIRTSNPPIFSLQITDLCTFAYVVR